MRTIPLTLRISTIPAEDVQIELKLSGAKWKNLGLFDVEEALVLVRRCQGGTSSCKHRLEARWTLTSILTQLGTFQGIPGQISFPHAHVSVLAQKWKRIGGEVARTGSLAMSCRAAPVAVKLVFFH